MKKKAFWVWLTLSVLWIGVIFWHSSRVAAASDAESLGLLYYVQKILPWMTNNLLRKCGHFAEFSILGVLLTGLFHRLKNFILLKPVACGLFVALCDETIQRFVPGRSGNVRDLWIDLGGAVFGTLLLWIFFRLRNKET
ncbi:MAG: VanZ family protein [Oscillospiraceae bacterium]|nr:VanZ family protein [Oscillospiraceae bacterium]